MPVSFAVDQSAVARVVGIKTEFKDLRQGNIVFLPQRVAVIGQGSTSVTYDLTKVQLTSAVEVGQRFGFGSPLHLAALQLLPANGDGLGSVPCTFYPLDDDGSGVAASGDITPSGTQSEAAAYQIIIGGVASEQFVIAVGDTVADVTAAMTTAINASLNIPVVAVDNSTDVGLTAKWAGDSSNDITIEIVGSTTAGTTFAITNMNGGLINPNVQPALDQVGDVWETMFVNCMNVEDTTTLDTFQTFNEGRWGPIVKKPGTYITGTNEADVNAAIAVPDARKTDRTNFVIDMPGSREMPLSIAARAVSRAAVRANNNPPYDYALMPLTGLQPGTDAQQWTYAQRDQAVKGGVATTEVKDGVPVISDFISFYHPDGDPNPAYRYLVDVVKVSNILFNLNLIFESEEWAGAPLIPDLQPINTNPKAKRPKTAVAAIAGMTDALGAQAIVSDPDFAKANTIAAINEQNPNRLDISYTVKISGHVAIISIDFNWGFYFGTAPVIS